MIEEAVFSSLVDQAYEAALAPEAWPAFLASLAEAYRGKASIFMQDLASAKADLCEFADFDEKFLASYVEHYHATNPVMPMLKSAPAGFLAIGEEMMPRDAFERSEWFNDWLRPQGLYAGIGSILLKNDTLTTNLTLLRYRSEGSFTPGELATWRRLVRHVQRALQIHRHVFAVKIEREGALTALAGLAIGVVITDSRARVLFSNGKAEEIIRAGDGLTARHGCLHATAVSCRARFAHVISEASRSNSGNGHSVGELVALPLRSGDAALSALVVPLRTNLGFGLPAPAALILINDGRRRAAARAADLVPVYGLTRAEARLLRGLLDGAPLGEYAARAGISLNTAKTLLKQVFAKTGHNRQADLIRAVLSNPLFRLAAGRE